MAKLSLAEYRLALKAEKEKKDKQNSGQTYNKEIYPFWNMDYGQIAQLRFLPDANEDNPNQWFVYKYQHELFIGGKKRKILCASQYGHKCPICEMSRAFYNAKDKKNGLLYYRKKIAIARVLVINDPLAPDPETGETYKGKVVRTQLANQVMTKILEAMTDETIAPMDDYHFDIDKGYDFFIKKDKSGEFPSYDTGSRFASKSTPIPQEYRDRIELVDLSTYLPPDPGLDKVQALLDAHLNGDELDEETIKKGVDEDEDHDHSTKVEHKPTPKVVEKVQEKVEEETHSESVLSNSDVIKKIQSRFPKK